MVSKTNARMVDSSIISVRTYGAVGDGVTGDSAAIQEAWNHVPSGGSLLIPVTGNKYVIDGTDDLSGISTYSFGVVEFDTTSGSTAPTYKNLLL